MQGLRDDVRIIQSWSVSSRVMMTLRKCRFLRKKQCLSVLSQIDTFGQLFHYYPSRHPVQKKKNITTTYYVLVFSIAKLNYWERIGHHWQRISFILSLFFPPHSRVLLELTLPKKPLILFSQMTILAALSRLLCGVAMFTTVSRNFFNSNWRSTLWLLLLPLLAHVQYKTRHWRYVIKNLPFCKIWHV